MEKVFQITSNGQQIQQADFGVIGDAAGRADDRVFAELLRMVPFNGTAPARGILPYLYTGATGSVGTVTPNGATGSVLVKPFRAFIGSRTTAATEARKYWRDIRSGLSVAEGATSTDTQLTLAANSSGNPRWDLVYAAVAVDANGASVQRKIKDPVSKVISTSTVVTTLVTSVSVAVVTGTPGASPAFPTLPSDSGGTYYIALAYVRVPNGFNATSTVAATDVNEIAPVLGVSSASGLSVGPRPADQMFTPGGTAISGTGTSSFTSQGFQFTGAAGQRPPLYLPPSMTGGEQLLIALDLFDASSANWSHQSGAVVDASRDWRNRLFLWFAFCTKSAVGKWAWQDPNAGSRIPSATPALQNLGVADGTYHNAQAMGMGESFRIVNVSTNVAQLVGGTNVPTATMANTAVVTLDVDTSTGALKFFNSVALPGCSIFLWLFASGQFTNPI